VAPSLLELKVTVPPNAHGIFYILKLMPLITITVLLTGEIVANETKLKDVGKFENLKHSKRM